MPTICQRKQGVPMVDEFLIATPRSCSEVGHNQRSLTQHNTSHAFGPAQQVLLRSTTPLATTTPHRRLGWIWPQSPQNYLKQCCTLETSWARDCLGKISGAGHPGESIESAPHLLLIGQCLTMKSTHTIRKAQRPNRPIHRYRLRHLEDCKFWYLNLNRISTGIYFPDHINPGRVELLMVLE